MSAPGARVSDTLARIERSMHALWADAGEGARSHASTLNLVVVAGADDLAALLPTVDAVSAQLAARTFLVTIDPRAEPWHFSGEVGAVCQLVPGQKGAGLCAERVELRLGAAVVKRVASIIDSLVDARLPAALWVAPGAHGAVVDALAPAVSRLVLDSGDVGPVRAAGIAALCPGMAEDLAFVRVRRWREMAARFFDDGALLHALDRVTTIELRHTAGPRHPSADAELWLGWFASRLGWSVAGTTLTRRDGAEVAVTLSQVELPALAPGRIAAIRVEAEVDGGRVVGSAARDPGSEHLHWTLSAPGQDDVSRRFAVPGRELHDLVLYGLSEVQLEPLTRAALASAAARGAAA